MHEARTNLGVAAVNKKIYAVGGVIEPPSRGQCVGTNEEYVPGTDTWAFKKSMPTPRASFGIAVYQNRIYCIGGYRGVDNSKYVLSAANEVYDPATDTWETKASMPTQRSFLTAKST
jgi:N-acetylneuraminic acid mutarotase